MKLIFFIFSCVMFFIGCTDKKLNSYLENNIAEIREFVVFGQNDNLSASLMCGKRETDYKMDGYATSLIEFGVITIIFKNQENVLENIKYILYVGTEKHEGTLLRNPYDGSYVADIGECVDKNNNISIDIFVGENKSSLKLKSVDSDWRVTIRDCLEIFARHHNDELNRFVIDKELQGEVYLKIINDYDIYASDYYYYINFISRTGDSMSILVSPQTGGILSSNSNLL